MPQTPSPAATLASLYAIEGIARKSLGAHSSRLIAGLFFAAELTITNVSLDNVLAESFAVTGCPLRKTLGSPSAQAIQSGTPPNVTGA
jgi:hypothetical protein